MILTRSVIDAIHTRFARHQGIKTAKSGQQAAHAAVSPRHRKIAEERLRSRRQRRVTVMARLLLQGTSNETPAHRSPPIWITSSLCCRKGCKAVMRAPIRGCAAGIRWLTYEKAWLRVCAVGAKESASDHPKNPNHTSCSTRRDMATECSSLIWKRPSTWRWGSTGNGQGGKPDQRSQ